VNQLTKYYVTTGKYKVVLAAKTPLEAAERATKRWLQREKFRPGRFTNVSEVGFYMDNDESSPDHKLDVMFESETLADGERRDTVAKLRRKKRKS
jgi:hypothetical protein